MTSNPGHGAEAQGLYSVGTRGGGGGSSSSSGGCVCVRARAFGHFAPRLARKRTRRLTKTSHTTLHATTLRYLGAHTIDGRNISKQFTADETCFRFRVFSTRHVFDFACFRRDMFSIPRGGAWACPEKVKK